MKGNLTPPYYAVIFTSVLEDDAVNYAEMADRMESLCSSMDGFLGMDHARSEMGITICYWRDLESIASWKDHPEHLKAQEKGISEFYRYYKVQVAKVEKTYAFNKE